MRKKPVGKIFTKTKTDEFSFVATEYFEEDFVEVDIPNRNGAVVIAEIIKKEGINNYLNNPEVMNYMPKDEQELISFNLYMFSAKPISIIENDNLNIINFPLPPGINVYCATKENVTKALDVSKGNIKIGNLYKSPNPEIKITADKLFQPHISVLGRTGSGKSHFVKGLSKHIKDRNLIIFSPTEEYNEIGKQCGMQIFTKQDILLPLEADFIASVYGMTLQEEILLKKFMAKTSFDKKVFSGKIANDLKNWIIQDAITPITKKKTRQKELFKPEKENLGEIEDLKIPNYVNTALHKLRSKSLYFSNKPMNVLTGKSIILDMSGIAQNVQEIVISYVLHNVLDAYRSKKNENKQSKLLLMIEEAHNFAPSISTTYCKDKIIQIAREGRKLGLNLCLITQRPRHLDQTVLSQCGSLFLFQIPHPDDVNHVFSASPVYSKETVELVQRLDTGKCLIIGNAFKYPIMCSINFE